MGIEVPPPGETPKSRFWLYAALILAGVVAVALLAGYIAGRAVVGRFGAGVIGALESSLDARIEVRRVSVTPMLQIVLEGVRVGPADAEGPPYAEVNRVVIYPQFFAASAGGPDINGVLLDRPLLHLRVRDGGALNIRGWVDSVLDCSDVGAMRGFPNRVIVRDGSVLIQRAGGGGGGATFIEAISGEAGKTVSAGLVVDLEGAGPAGEFFVEGDLSPCGGGGVGLDIVSDRWDFDAFLLHALRWIDVGGNPAAGLQIGEGEFEAKVQGRLSGMSAEGKISTDRYSARWSISSSMFGFTGLETKVAGGKAVGDGTVRFDSANLPVRMSFVLEDVETVRLLRRLFGFQYAPRARLAGFLKLTGSLAAPDSLRGVGGVEAGEGKIQLPPLKFGRFERYSSPSIFFDSFKSRVVREGGETRLYNMSLSGSGMNVKGRARLGGAGSPGGVGPGQEGDGPGGSYSASLEFSVSDIGELLSPKSVRHLLGSGSAEGELYVEGAAGRRKSLRGGGKVVISRGWLVSPYTGRGYVSSTDRLSFDNLSAGFSFTERSISLDECKLNGNGLFIDVSGRVGDGGELEFRGRADVSGDVARKFTSLWKVVERREMIPSVTFDIPFTIRGTVEEPALEWGSPKVTHW